MIELVLPLPTPSLNYTLGRHWSRKAKLRKQWAWMVRAERLRLKLFVKAGFTPHQPGCFIYDHAEALMGADRRGLCTCGAEQKNLQGPRPFEVSVDRYGPRVLDHDNFVAGAKQLIDALVAEGFLVDDSPAHLQATYRQHVGKPYRTEVRIE